MSHSILNLIKILWLFCYYGAQTLTACRERVLRLSCRRCSTFREKDRSGGRDSPLRRRTDRQDFLRSKVRLWACRPCRVPVRSHWILLPIPPRKHGYAYGLPRRELLLSYAYILQAFRNRCRSPFHRARCTCLRNPSYYNRVCQAPLPALQGCRTCGGR